MAISLRLNKAKSSMGELVRSSHQMKAASSTANNSRPATIGPELHPIRLAIVSRIVSKAPADSIYPNQSKLGRRSRRASGKNLFGSKIIGDISIATNPTGTLIRNTQRQPKPLTRKPPRAGPMTAPVPTTQLCEPKVLPRSLPGNTQVIMAALFAWIMADPAP